MAPADANAPPFPEAVDHNPPAVDTDKPLQLWFNGHDWVVAHSDVDAAAILMANLGVGAVDADGEGWQTLPPEEVIKLTNEERGSTTHTAAEWILLGGRCYLASTEW